MIKFKKRK